MRATDEQAPGRIRRFWRGFVGQWIGTVPDELSVCEFECRKPDCSLKDWRQCPLWLEFMGRSHSESDSSDRKAG